MESSRESLARLISIISGRGKNHAQEERLQALSQLTGLISPESDETVIDDLITCVQQERDDVILTRVIQLLSAAGPVALPVITDVLLATHVAIYEGREGKDFVKTEQSTRLRCQAARALGLIGDNRAVVSLMSILNDRDENYRLRLAAAESLGKVGDEYVVKPLIDLLSDEREKSVYLKESVARALGMLGDIRAVEPMIDILESKQGIRDKFNFLKERLIEAIAQIGRPSRKATHGLLTALTDEAPSIRLAAVEALGTLGDHDCLVDLQQCIFDEDDDVARAAVNAVYSLGGERAVKELLQRENLPQFIRDELEGYIP
jgi:HEAT repeat protein